MTSAAAPFERQHAQHLAPRETEMAQHAELAPPRPGERREAGGHARERDEDRRRLQRVGGGEGAVEDGERAAVDVARVVELRAGHASRSPSRGPRNRLRVRARREVDRDVVRERVAGDGAIVREVDHERAPGARVVAEGAGHRGSSRGGPRAAPSLPRRFASRRGPRTLPRSTRGRRPSRGGASGGSAWKPRKSASHPGVARSP